MVRLPRLRSPDRCSKLTNELFRPRNGQKTTADSRALAFEVADILKATVGGPAYIEAYQRARDELAEARMERKRKRAFEVRANRVRVMALRAGRH